LIILVVKIVKDSLFDSRQLKMLQDEMHNILGQKINIDIQFVDEILLTKTGKFRVTVPNIK
jgi:hypothetical protein